MSARREPFDVIVIGAAGAMGSSTCWHLARRGVRVLGLDRFGIGHDRGSSHGYSRMIRTCYYEHPDYVPLLRRAYELWRELEQESGERLLFTPGGLYLGRPDSELIAGSRRAAAEHGLAHEVLTRAEVAARWPRFEVPGDFVGLFEPAAGWLMPERAIGAMVRLARAGGAEIRTGEVVEAWGVVGEQISRSAGQQISEEGSAGGSGGGVWVRTVNGEYRARRLVIAAGVWANKVVGDLGVAITPTRQTLAWYRAREGSGLGEGELPVWAVETEKESEWGGDLFYGFPETMHAPEVVGGGALFKAARHAKGPVIDPEVETREVRAGDGDDVTAFLRRFIPAAVGGGGGGGAGGSGDGPAAVRVCVYENSPDSHFVIDRHPRHVEVLVAAGFSGHGFKFASVVGEVLAEMAMGEKIRREVGFLGLGRFGKP